MRLTLSSSALPEAALPELVAAGVRRGFAGLELEEGHAHGLGPGAPTAAVEAMAAGAARSGLPITAFRLGDAGRAADPATARLGTALGAPIVATVDPDHAAIVVADAVPHFAEAGTTLLLAVETGRAEVMAWLRAVAEMAPPGAVGLAWDIDPGAGPLTTPDAVLEAGGGRIRHIRLQGGGPEAVGQVGLGIGRLMGALALAGYAGTFALAPSTPRFRHAWRAWLGHRGGWGCGSKAGAELIGIAGGPGGAGR